MSTYPKPSTPKALMLNRPAPDKSQEQLAQEWDRLASLRAEHILSGNDLSYSFILVPTILGMLGVDRPVAVLDIGCGVGVLTRRLSEVADRVVGIDSSSRSIKLARELHGGIPNLELFNASLETFAATVEEGCFTLVVANMLLMNVPALGDALTMIRSMLAPGGALVFTITHPCFWPIYWGYASEQWFRYTSEIAIESEFRISLESYNGLTATHYHRPFEHYVSALVDSQFRIDKVSEPMPDRELEARYPSPWGFPRFLAMRCTRS